MKTQFAVLLLARIFATGMQALTFILLARWAGVRDFGVIGVIAGVCAVLFTVADWGLSSYIPRARAMGREHEVASGIRMDCLGNAVAGIGAAAAVALLIEPLEISWWFCLVPVALAVEQFTEVALTIPIADGDKAVFVFSLALRRIISIALFVPLYLAGWSAVAAFAVAGAAAALAGLVHVLFVLRRRLSGHGRAPFRPLYKALVPYVLANLSAQSRTLDTALVSAVASAASAGLYSAAFRLINPLLLVSSSLVAVLLPHASRKNLDEAKHLGRRLTLVTLATGALLVPLALNAGPVVQILFGQEFAGAAPAFAFAVASLPFLSLAPPMGGLLQSQGFEAFVARNGLVFAAVNMGTVILGALLWGPAGAAAAVALTYAGKSASLYIRLQTARQPLEQSARTQHEATELRTV